MAQIIYVNLLYDFGVTFSVHSQPRNLSAYVVCLAVRTFRTALLELCTSKQFLHLLELFACDCLNYVLAHSSNLSQFADVMQSITTKQSQVNVAFAHLHFESTCFVCVYTSLIFGFYQICAAVFAEPAFFIMVQFQGVAVSPGSLSEASSVVFVAFTFALLCYIWFCHAVCFTYLHYSGFIFVFSRTFLLQCVLGDSSLIT